MGEEAHEIRTLTKLSRYRIFAPTRPDNFTSSTNSIGARVESYHGTYLYHEFDFFKTSTIYISTKHEPKTPWGINLPLPLPLPALIQCHVVYPNTKLSSINRLYTKSPPASPLSPLTTPPFPTPAPSIPFQPCTTTTSHLHLLPAPPKFPSTTRRCFPSQLLGLSLWRCTVMPLYWWRAARLWKAEDMSRSSRLRFVFSVWRDGGSVGWRGCC